MSDLDAQLDTARRHERTLKIAKMYTDNVPVSKIGDTFGVSRNTVLRIARMFNYPRREKQAEGRYDAIILELKKGRKQKDIAAELGVSVALVSMVGKSSGLSRYASVHVHAPPYVGSDRQPGDI